MRSLFRKPIIGIDKTLLVKDAVKLMPEVSRRRTGNAGASLGALTPVSYTHLTLPTILRV